MSGFIVRNWFILGLLAAVGLGMFLPDVGAVLAGGSWTSTGLVILIFFISGFILPREVIRNGLKDIRFHVYIQLFIFALVPAYFFASSLLVRDSISPGLLIGIYALACLPTTISTCVIFTQASGGNVVGTMFNSALANALGIVASPLLLSFFLNSSGRPLDLREAARIFIELGWKMLAPIVLGQLARAFYKDFAERNKKRMGVINNLSILCIVLITISKTARDPLFRANAGFGPLPLAYLALSFPILMALAYWSARLLGFSRQNVISAVYTAPQKTLALGVPLLSTFFAGDASLGAVAILPLLFYHPWQLFVSGLVKGLPFMRKET